ncbi:hypothetical protein E8E14_011782 [Neopestalotiopsis sp. 37M]|nr:hypothetical protein E8E14_011782 [Neopestalotiopsis sp. 37M]
MDLVKSQFRQLQPPRQTSNEGGVPGDPNLITSLLKGSPRYRPYKHEPLDSSSFRILRLYPAHRFEDDIKCEVQQASLPENGVMPTPYMALSHVWGTESVSCAVTIGKQHILIRSNLESALRHLRHRERIVSLWIDALCIDQSNTEERNHQVQHMRDIYEAAEETIVFLGDQDGGNTGLSAWNYLERNSPWALNEEGEKDYDLPARIDSSPDFRGDMDDICINVLPREWFSRLWVLQEFVVSKSVSLQCGHRRVPAETLVKLVLFEPRRHDRYGAWVRQRELFASILRMWASRTAFHMARYQEHYLLSWHKDASEGVTTDLLDTILRAMDLVASDPRDKIIGLLGISSGFDWRLNNTVDYNLTVRQLYTKFAHDFLRTKRGFRILSYWNRAASVSHIDRTLTSMRWFYRRQRIDEELAETAGVSPSKLGPNTFYKDRVVSEQILRIFGDRISRLLENEDYDEAKNWGMPSWVPDWQYRPSDTHYKVMPIIESLHSKGDTTNRQREYFETETDIFRMRTIGLYRSSTPSDWRGSTSPTHSDVLPPRQSTGTSDDSNRPRYPPPDYSDESPPQQSSDISDHEFSDYRISEDWSEVEMSDNRTNDDWSEVGMSGYDDDDDPDLPGKSRRQSEDRNEGANNEDHTPVLEWTPGSPRSLALLPPDVKFGDLIVYFPGAQVPFVVRPLRNTLMGNPDPTVSTAGLRFAEDIEEHMHCKFVGECWINDFPKIEQEMEKLDCLFHIS